MDRYAEAKKICRMLTQAGHPTMLAGGCVRDRLFGLEPSDYDLATTARPEVVVNFFESKDYQTVPVGIEHGTVLVVGQTQSLEITTLRHDVDCDGRRAVVRFSQDFPEDAKRRDFTINALFEDADGQLRDYVGGCEDLKAERLRFVGDPKTRIQEDYLRILRYFRFMARLGWEPDQAALTAVGESLQGLTGLSQERVLAEMKRTLTAPHFHRVLPHMAQTGVLKTLYPWFRPETLSTLTALFGKLRVKEPTLPWFILIYGGSAGQLKGKPLQAELQRLRFGKSVKKTLPALIRLYENLDDASTALPVLLSLADHESLDLRELNHLFECSQDVPDWSPDLPVLRLLHGLIHRVPPEIPREAIMAIPPQERGGALELVKIYWYLGLCRAKTHMTDIMKARHQYAAQLNMHQLSTKLTRDPGSF